MNPSTVKTRKSRQPFLQFRVRLTANWRPEMVHDEAKLLLSPKVSRQLSHDFPDETLLDGVQLFRAVRFLAQRMNEATSSWLAPFGVSSTKFNYLAVLYSNRDTGLTAGELGASARTSSGSVTTMIDALERERLVARHGHPTDGRSVVIKLTAKGERLYLDSARAQHDRLITVINALGTEKTQRLLRQLVEAGNALHAVVSEEP